MSDQLFIFDAKLAQEKRYWEGVLSNKTYQLHWPVDDPGPKRGLSEIDSFMFQFSNTVSSALLNLSNGSDFLLFVALLTGIKLCVFKYTGESKLHLGSAAKGDHNNAVTVISDISNDLSFERYLKRLKEILSKAYLYQNYPIDRLKRDIFSTNYGKACPFFDLLVAYHPLHLKIPQVGQGITLRFYREDGLIKGVFEYKAVYYFKETVARIVNHLENLIQQGISQPKLAFSDYEILTPNEKEVILTHWSTTKGDDDFTYCIHQLFEQQVSRHPCRTALIMNGVNVSFLEVNQRANRLAHRLIAEKINVGDHVGILLPRSIDLIVAVFAILKAGGIYVPLNPEYPTQYLTDIVNDSGVKCVITDDILSSKLFTDQVCLISLSTWQSQATEFSDENPNLSISSKQNAYIIYTSGTTGRPKGVLVKHYSVINLVKGLQTSILQQYPQPLRLSLNAPLSFDVSVKQITQLLNGHSIAIIPENIRYDGEDLLNYLATHQVNIFDCTPSHFKILMAAGLVSRTDLAIRAFFLGGEAIDNSLWTKLIHETKFDFYNGYGPTECTVTTTKTKIDHNVSIPVLGRPIPNAQVYILDDYLKPVPIGVIGEIYIGGAGVATGYLNRSKLTEEKFLPHPYSSDIKSKLYKTGDLGSFTKEGIIRFHGRNDQQVKVSGYRIELGEIEHTLRSHNKIKDCFVHIVDINHQKQIVAYLVFNPDNKIDLKEVKQYLRKCLPAYMVPSFIIPINEIPLTQHGKINLKQLPNPEQYIKESVSNKTIPLMGEIEEKIAQVWKNALRIEKVNLEDNFFEIGGYSLLLYQVRRRLESTLKVRFSTIELFENPTIRSLSERVQQKMKGEGLTRKIGEQSSEELKVDRKIKDCGEHAIIAVHRYNGFYKADEQNKTEFKDDRFKKRKRAIERKKNKELMKKK